jgi:Fe-S cluster biogenesis protein NfuA
MTLKEKVIKVLDSIRPGLEADGGDIKFIRIDDDNIVYVHLTGACGDCPMSQITLKQGIERIIKMQVPEIKAVEAI